MARIVKSVKQSYSSKTASFNSDFIDIDGAAEIGITQVIDVSTPSADNFIAGVANVDTITNADKATSVTGDHVIFYDDTGNAWGYALDKRLAEVTSINFADKASTTAGDYFVVYDASGNGWAAAMNVAGTDPAPTGAIYTALAAGRKVNVDVSSATFDEDIAALVKTAMEALTGFASAFTITDPADGTLTFTAATVGACTDAVVKSADDAGAGSIAKSVTTQGINIGTPSGALYTAIPVARKALVDINTATTATQVCDLVRTALNALTGFSDAFTTSGTATLILTNDVRGVVTNSVAYDSAETGASSISIAQTTAGVNSEVSASADTVTLTAHGMGTGLKGQLTSTGTLPAGLSLATDYFIIVVDADTVSFAVSLADAVAGTAVDITGQGTSGATHTFTPTALAGATYIMQVSTNDDALVDGIWYQIGSPISITTDVTVISTNAQVLLLKGHKYFRIAYVMTAGQMNITNYIHAHSDLG